MIFKTKGTEIIAEKDLANLRKIKNKEYKFKLALLKSHKKIVFICSPYADIVELNTERAKYFARFAALEGVVPFVPHLLYPRFLSEENPKERELGIEMGLKMLTKCDELWVFGERLSKGMAREMAAALKRKMPIKFYTSDCKQIIRKIVY